MKAARDTWVNPVAALLFTGLSAAHLTRVLVLINATASIYRFGRYLRLRRAR